MMHGFYLLGVLLAAFAAFPALAAGPLVFSREMLYIENAPRPAADGASETDADTGKAEAKEARNGKKAAVPNGKKASPRRAFRVEVVPASSFNLDWFQNMRPVAPDSGLLVTMGEDELRYLDWSRILIPLDVLFLEGDGRIARIMPDFFSAQTQTFPDIAMPVAAILFLKAGNSETLNIRPGDHATHSLFAPPPKILEAPAKK